MNRLHGLAVGIGCLGFAALVTAMRAESVAKSSLGATAGFMLLLVAIVLVLSTFDRGRTKAWLRLDWFLPALRRREMPEHAGHALLGRWLRRVIPHGWQSNWRTKRRGFVRRGLRSVGLSWLASPVRRLVQSACLLVFLVLFFYVCWPYDARPRSTPTVSTSWVFTSLDPQTGEYLFESSSVEEPLETRRTVYIVGEEVSLPPSEFEVISATETALKIRPTRELSGDWFDAIVTSTGRWDVYDSDPNAWPSHYADNLASKEWIPAESFLMIDPLVGLSTAIASRSWVWSLTSAGTILIVCVLVPRGFCGYLCPLGTTIDLFDWAIGRRVTRFRVPDDGWWVHTKYYLLAGTLVCAVGGVLLSGFVSAIPVVTRAALFLAEPLQSGTFRGWHLVPTIGIGHVLSIVLFGLVLALGFLRPRFWCKYVCPSGAVFSIGNLFRVSERKVESSCIHCNKCVEICPFDAIKPDFTTRATDCTLCQSCAGVCPTHAIKFVERWNVVELKVENDPPTHETAIGRRGFLSLAAGSAAAIGGGAASAMATKTLGARIGEPGAFLPVRPPGSVPEQEFLQMCIRCGECFKACPNNVLTAEGFEQGLEGLWTPMVNADWAGCESSCNACGQVCPTGAIRELPLQEKRVARMGLAVVNNQTCLPFDGLEECDLCVQECHAAGYHAIEYEQVNAQVDDQGIPIPGTGFSAPVVLADRCVGCGLCQTRCVAINVKDRGVLSESAIVVEAGEGKEDRLLTGSYLELRAREAAERRSRQPRDGDSVYSLPRSESDRATPGSALPGSAIPGSANPADDSDPFGVEPSVDDVDDDPFGLLPD